MKKCKLSRNEKDYIINVLDETYADAKAELNFSNPFELLVATILSAQCTDVRVNIVTKKLFEELKSPKDYIDLGQKNLEEEIKSCGLSKTKSKNIIESCKLIIEEFSGNVPKTMEDIMKLPGVGRKTANVVLSNAYGVPGIAVDTHVFRVSNRIGLVKAKDVLATEMELMKVIPEKRWTKMHHVLIFHGRRCCTARKPKCDICPVKDKCVFYCTN